MYGNEQLFATKYKLYLSTKEELKVEIETQKAMFYLQQQDSREWKDGSNLKRIRLFWIMVLYNVPNIIAYCDSAKTKYDMCVIVWVELLVKLTKSCTGINWKLGS